MKFHKRGVISIALKFYFNLKNVYRTYTDFVVHILHHTGQTQSWRKLS